MNVDAKYAWRQIGIGHYAYYEQATGIVVAEIFQRGYATGIWAYSGKTYISEAYARSAVEADFK